MNELQFLAVLAFGVIIFLTARDIRIFKRTKLESYKKGSIRGIIAAFIAMLGLTASIVSPQLALLIILIALFINIKKPREDVFGNASTWDRLTGNTKPGKDEL